MKRFTSILLIVDEGADYAPALNRAVTLAGNNQALLTVCTVADEMPGKLPVTAVDSASLQDIIVAEKQGWLETVVEPVVTGGLSLKTNVLVGKPFVEIIREVLRGGHDLIIKCAEVSVGLRKVFLGSADMHLIRKCPCPVWIIKPTEHHKYRRILAAVDQDPGESVKEILNRQILEMATSLALAEFGELHIVHVWRLQCEDFLRSSCSGLSRAECDAMVAEDASNRKRWLENLVSTYGASADKDAVDYLDPRLHLIKGDARHVVAATARELDVDLVVMGTVARAGIAGFFIGNTAESILNQLDCSVLTVKPPGFISPVTFDP